MTVDEIVPKSPDEIRRANYEDAIRENGFGEVIFWRKDVDVAHRLSDKVTEVSLSLLKVPIDSAIAAIEGKLDPGRAKPMVALRNIDEVLTNEPVTRDVPVGDLDEDDMAQPEPTRGPRCRHCGATKTRSNAPCPNAACVANNESGTPENPRPTMATCAKCGGPKRGKTSP